VHKQPGMSASELLRFCPRCEDLDIARVRSSTQPRLALGPVKHWQPDICTLCRFLINLLSRQPEANHLKDQPYFLFSIKTRYVPDRLFQILDHRLIVLSTSENGPPPDNVPYIAAHTGEFPSWLKCVEKSVNFDQVQEWLKVCTELHADRCSGDRSNKICNLRLIDCSSGEVVEAKESDLYVALSYVWGNEDTSAQESLAYPRTIQDAMIATQKLGYQRLWVDKYCINQDNRAELYNQLQQMDAIYQQATVTIIAAAGTNAHYGLPGVGKTFRNPTVSVSIHNERLTAIPKLELRPDNCRWISRAWTYQEGLLSVRRLVFTDDQLYFECQGCYCAEMLDIPLENFKKLHAPDKPWLQRRYRTAGRMGIFPLDGCGVDPWDIYCRISEYSQRSLSHESDILNGILGIFRAFDRMDNSMWHLHGIPFPKSTSHPNETKMFTNSKRSLPTFSESLRWGLEMPSQRRKGFPSWSWTGWYGTITWPAEYTDVDVIRTPRRVERPRDPKVNEKALQVSVELQSGRTMSWKEFQEKYNMLLDSDELSGFINVEAYTTPVSFLPDVVDDQPHGTRFLLRLADGTYYPLLALRTTTRDLQPHDTLLAIHFHRTVKGSQGRDRRMAQKVATAIVRQHLLVVQQIENHWERVAIGSHVVDPEKNLQSNWQCIRLG
jgi:hypothetical protein